MSIWQKFFQVLSHKEKIAVNILILVIAASLILTIVGFYYYFTKPIPISGGDYSEGIVGQPMYINPVLASGNEADADLCQLVYSSLFKYDAEGKIILDLAESYETDKNGLTYTIKLRKEVKWHDGESFTADDVLFTIQAVQDPAFKSPLRQIWQGVGVETDDESTVRFILQSPYAFFLNNLTIGILPKHVWETVAPANFPLAEYNLRPVGAGPYKFSDFEKDPDGNILSYDLEANENYFGPKSLIGRISFSFYFDEDSMLEAYNNKQIFGLSYLSPSRLGDLKSRRSADIHSINIPRYFAVFLNQQKSKILADRDVRKALSLATDKKTIISEVLGGEGKEVYSPIPPGSFGVTDDIKKFEYNTDEANKTLDNAGWKKGENGFRRKDNQPLEMKLVATDWPDLAQTAEMLKKQWEAVGVKVNIETLDATDVQQNYIRPREYEALLFGQMLGVEPDPYAFWSSSQTRDPGLNLALYSNQNVDKILEKIRQETDSEKRAELYKEFQQNVSGDVPVIFLYSPNYLYITNKKVQGVKISSMNTPDKRFANVTEWYMKTKRVKK